MPRNAVLVEAVTKSVIAPKPPESIVETIRLPLDSVVVA
jgi:hypothetical protein